MEGAREFTCKEGLLLKEEQRLGKWKKRWMVLRVNEKGDPSLYYYQVDDYINECMPLGFVVPSSCTLFEYPAKNFAFELVSPPSYNGLSPRPATHFRFQATNLDEFKSWISVLSLYTMPIEEMYNVARNGIEPVRSHSCESVAQSPLTRSPTNIRSKEWEDNEAVLMKLFPDVELQTIVDALEFCRGNRNDAIDLLAEQNKLSSSTNNKNLVNGLSPHNEVTSGQLKRAKSTMNLSDPNLISSPSPFLSPDFSSSELDKDSITPLPPPLPPPLSLSGLSISPSASSEEIPPPLPSVSVYKPKPLRAISPSQASQSLSLSNSLSSNSNPLSRSRIHIVPPLQLPLPQTYEPEQTHPHKNQQGQNNKSVQQVHNNSQEKEGSIKEEDKENHQTQYLHLQQLLQKKPISPPPNQEISSVPSIPSISSHSSTPTSPSYEKKATPPSVSSSSVKKLSPLTIPSSSPPPPPTSQHYLYYNQQQQQHQNQNYQPLVSPHSASSLSSSHQPHISISLQSTPHSPLSLESTPRTPQSPSSPTSPTYASPSPRLHHQFTQQYRYSYRSAPSIGGHSTINHFEAYSSPSLDLSDDSSSYHSHSHPGFGGLANYNIVGSPNSGGFSPSSPNYGKFQSAINSQNQYKPANPISFRIVGATRNTYYMDYIVEVVTPDLRWLVYRRYSNFSLLNSKLLKMELAHPSKNVMPPKQFSLPSFPLASDDLVNRRVESLGIYLNSLVEDNPSNAKFFLGHPLGQAFINPHITSNEHNKFVNNLPTEK